MSPEPWTHSAKELRTSTSAILFSVFLITSANRLAEPPSMPSSKSFLPIPEGLDITEAAALPMAVETAARTIDLLPLTAGQTLMVNGGGTMTGFAAVQIALLRGAHVIASAGETFADRLREIGAKVTPYGDGMVERVRELAGGAPDFALHTAQVKGTLPDLVKIVDGDPKRVFSFADRDEEGIGVRTAWRRGR